MNGLLLAFLMSMPVNSTYDPETEYLKYGERVVITFKEVKIPLMEYEMDWEGCGCCIIGHDEQLENLETTEENEYEYEIQSESDT